jgi:ABC-type proline/glycine betaine transport system permease subunit
MFSPVGLAANRSCLVDNRLNQVSSVALECLSFVWGIPPLALLIIVTVVKGL